MLESDGRNLFQAEALGGFEASVSGNHAALGIDQNRYVEAKGLDTLRDLTHLASSMNAGVFRVRSQALDRQVVDRQGRMRMGVRIASLRSVCAHLAVSKANRGADRRRSEKRSTRTAGRLNEQLRVQFFLFGGRPRDRP